ncbi:hypothetical protein MNBD_GAMMA10-2311 [hydrothermal vent metagenome]|uniref:Uncharacterized protein n=1 Tax=hydrothermal vent metagenome TaxID=652676 RepID=A0A3B0XNW3_9ZZZZ
MSDKYIYAGKPAQVHNASNVSGMLLRSFNGRYFFRVYTSHHEFTDYELNHDDLPITIDSDSLASFYTHGDNHSLDHSPEVLGLQKVDE